MRVMKERYKIWYYRSYQNQNSDWGSTPVVVNYKNTLEEAKEYIFSIHRTDDFLGHLKDEELRITKEIYEEIIPGFFEWESLDDSDLFDFEILEEMI